MAFNRANIEPQIRNFEKILLLLKSIENIISKINATNICTNNKDTKHFIQALKNPEVEETLSDKNANGDISTNTFIII